MGGGISKMAKTERIPVRWSGLRGVPAAVPVRRRGTGHRTDGATAPAGGFIAAGPGSAASEAFAEYRQRRVVVEHRLARLVQLGIRQSRYFGRIRTRFQLYLTATVANLTMVAANAGTTGETAAGPRSSSALIAGAAWLGQMWTLTLLASASLTKSFFPTRGFRPDF